MRYGKVDGFIYKLNRLLLADSGLTRQIQSGRFASTGSCPKRSGTSIWALNTYPNQEKGAYKTYRT